MKGDVCADLICRGFCRYYRPGREALQCGAYTVLSDHLATGELKACTEPDRGKALSFPDSDADSEIRMLACAVCDFLVDGCDFREDRSGPPCGGYYVLEILLKERDSFLKS